jgi:hypothetical protein
MGNKAKLGRPPLPKGHSKKARLFCRLLAAEVREIETAARNDKKTKSEWIREVLLSAARSQKPKSKN